jgi:hypothetical protein
VITDEQLDAFKRAFYHRLHLGAREGETPGERWKAAVVEGVEAAVAAQLSQPLDSNPQPVVSSM